MPYFVKHSPKVAKKGLVDLISSGKIKFCPFSGNHVPTDKEAFEELRCKPFVRGDAGYFFYGDVDVTTSVNCFLYNNGRCPRSGAGWKNCYEDNTPCKEFRYMFRNGTNK